VILISATNRKNSASTVFPIRVQIEMYVRMIKGTSIFKLQRMSILKF